MRQQQLLTGFTMIEIVIMLGIILIIAGIVLFRFPAFSQRINAQRGVQELALAMRELQNMAFAVREVDVPPGYPTPPGFTVPPAFGVYFNRVLLPNSFILFADLRGIGGTNDRRFNASDDLVIRTVTLGPGLSVSQLISDIGGANQANDILNVVFTVPEARVFITSDAGLMLGESAEIYIAGPVSAFDRSVLIRTTGQIHIK